MPPGEVDTPKSDDGALKTGYLLRFDQLDSEGGPARIPLLNGQELDNGDAVVFDVLQFQINVNGDSYFIPVAVIPDDLVNYLKDKTSDAKEIFAPNNDKDWETTKKKIQWEEQWGDNKNPLKIEKKESKYKIKNIQQIRGGKTLKIKKQKKRWLKRLIDWIVSIFKN